MYTVVRSALPFLEVGFMKIEIDDTQWSLLEQALKAYIQDIKDVSGVANYERSKEILLESADRYEKILRDLHSKAQEAGYKEYI